MILQVPIYLYLNCVVSLAVLPKQEELLVWPLSKLDSSRTHESCSFHEKRAKSKVVQFREKQAIGVVYSNMDKYFVAENITIGPSMYQVTKIFVAKNIAIGYSYMNKRFVAENIAIGPSMYQVAKIFVAKNIAIRYSNMDKHFVAEKIFCIKKYLQLATVI